VSQVNSILPVAKGNAMVEEVLSFLALVATIIALS